MNPITALPLPKPLPSKLIYDFCKQNGICTSCRCNWSRKDANTCGPCGERLSRASVKHQQRDLVARKEEMASHGYYGLLSGLSRRSSL